MIASVRLSILVSALLVAAVWIRPAAAQQTSWATKQAEQLTSQGKAHVDRGATEPAVRRFLEAIELDGTYAPAYVALGALRESVGDLAEAERTYSLGISHIPGFAEALVGRARVRARLGRRPDALGDLREAARLKPYDLVLLERLAKAYVEAAALPAALAVTRRMVTVAEREGQDDVAHRARVQAAAIQKLVGELDPVQYGLEGRGPVRRAIARRGEAAPRGGATPAGRGPGK